MAGDTLIHDGQLVWRVPYGPLMLLCRRQITAEDVDRAGPDDSIWDDLGMEVDPRRYRDDFAGLAREILLYMTLEELATGVDWDLDAGLLAARICMSEAPVVIPFWTQL